MRIVNATRNRELAASAEAARSFRSKMVGLLGRSSLAPGEGLVLKPCSSVHTAFMRFPIDVLYVRRDGTVKKVVAALPPFRMSGVLGTGCSVIELPAGTLEVTGTVVGDEITFDA